MEAKSQRKEHPAQQECTPDGFRFFINNDLEKKEISILPANAETLGIRLYGQEDAEFFIEIIRSCIQEWKAP